MTEIAPETIRAALALELGDNDSGEPTIRRYLLRLLGDVWSQGEGFDGKRPFGNSSWESDLHIPLIRAGLVAGKLDSDGCIEQADERQADAIIAACINALDCPQPAEPEQPATVIVTTDTGAEIRYRADDWDTDDQHRLTISRQTGESGRHVTEHRIVAEHAPGAWRSVRNEDATGPDATRRGLDIAKAALTIIARNKPENPRKTADEALEQIWAECEE